MKAHGQRLLVVSLLIVPAVIVVAFTPALGQAVLLDHVDGLDDPTSGVFGPGAILTFHMRVIGDADNHLMLNNGFVFRASSPDLTWGSMTGGYNTLEYPELEEWFDFVMVMNFWADGQLADTVGVGLLSLFGPGLPVNYNGVMYSFTLGPVAGMALGAILTLDSSWYPPSNPWMWDIVGDNVAWGGPYEFRYGTLLQSHTYCEPQPTILKSIEDILRVHIRWEDPDMVDMQSIRVQGKIPPYEGYPVVEDYEIVTACFIMRFLGSSGFRPITGDFEATYTVDYNYLDGTAATTLVGDYALKVYPGDVTLDGQANIDDLIFAADYFWKNGAVPFMLDNTGQAWEVAELLDVDGNGEANPLDVRKIVELAGL